MASPNPSKLFTAQVLTTSAATIFTATDLLKNGRVRFTNTTAGAITVNAHVVAAAGSASDSNAFLKLKSIAASDYLDVDLPSMISGDFLQALASANTSCTIHEIGGIYWS